jgi:hypothetical protein
MRRHAAALALAVAAATLTGCPRSAPKYGGPPPPDPGAEQPAVEPTAEDPVQPSEPVPTGEPSAVPDDPGGGVEMYGAPSPPDSHR